MDLAAALRFPLNKLFGDSASGFGGGQDAMENYNAQVSTLRDEIGPLVTGAAELRCQQLFGFIPEDLELSWRPLREMSGPDEETVLTQRSTRTLAWFQAGLLTDKEASVQARKLDVITEDTEILKGKRHAQPQAMVENDLAKAQLEGQSAAGEGPGKSGAGSAQESKPTGSTARDNARRRHERRQAGRYGRK